MAAAPKGKRFVAPKGNRFWEARSSHGRKPIFETPDALADACQQYFQWVEDNPLWEEKHFHHQGTVTKTKLPKMRAMTLDGLCLFLDIDDQTWRNYAAKRDFIGVTSRVMAAIRTQKFSGAAADLLNANIIARDLGLSDKSELSGKDGGAIQIEDKTDRDPMELARAVIYTLNKGLFEASQVKKQGGDDNGE